MKIIKTIQLHSNKLLALLSSIFLLLFIFSNKLYCLNDISPKDYANDKITIRFNPSAELEMAMNNKPIPELNNILGEYTIYRYIEDELLFDSRKNNFEKLQDESSPYSRLYRTYIVELQGKFDIPLLLERLNTLLFIEIAEIVPIIHFYSTPNDPKASEQYHLKAINAFDAWDLVQSDDSVIVAILDCGIDDTHPDLKDNIFINQGETGTDKYGNDKSSNGIDDDNNGYIDDWRGWDFFPTSGHKNGNNDPTPFRDHGTHVAGICGATPNNGVGVAGIGKNVKLMNIQISEGETSIPFAFTAHKGMLYAAKMGAKILNCSWGGGVNILAQEEVVKILANEYKALIVCAAGNSASERETFPSAYKECLNVASSDKNNEPSYFTDYGDNVAIVAPGSDILSTVLEGKYEEYSGTSMASPVVAGVAALVALKYPEYGGEEIKHLLCMTANKAICDSSYDYFGKLGAGLVDAKAALSVKDPKYISIDTLAVLENKKSLTMPVGDELRITASGKNIFCDLENVEMRVKISGRDAEKYFDNLSYTLKIGKVTKKEVLKYSELPICKVKAPLPDNYSIMLELSFWSNGEMLSSNKIIKVLNSNYANIYGYTTAASINNRGNIGYLDPLCKDIGIPFRHFNGLFLIPILEECSFLLANIDESIEGGYELWDAARNSISERNRDFQPMKAIEKDRNEVYSWGRSYYTNKTEKDQKAKFEIRQTIVMPTNRKDELKRYMLVEYNIKNVSNTSYDSLYAGMFQYYGNKFDKLLKNNDKDYYFSEDFTDYAYNQIIATKLLSDIENHAKTLDFCISHNLSDSVKINALTAKQNDLKHHKEEKRLATIMSAGAFSLNPGESKKIQYLIVFETNYNRVDSTFLLVETINKWLDQINRGLSKVEDPIYKAYYANGKVQLITDFNESQIFDIFLYDINGKLAKTVANDAILQKNQYTVEFELGNPPAGAYFLILKNTQNKHYIKLLID